ncbi:MAG: hypothetical protein WBA45_14110 [Microthrixaceae bacterium]
MAWHTANQAEVTMYVPFDSFAGGDSSGDPTTLEFDFYGFEDEDDYATYTVELDQGAAFYSESVDIDIETDTDTDVAI